MENQFTNWDDPGYLIDNPVIRDLSIERIKDIFSISIMGNYHPFTLLSYAIEYSYAGLAPRLYHADSLILHILITVLTYRLTILLTGRPFAAAITSLLFGLHPMHVESVAWIAGRKDLIYGAFYMAACTAYIHYVRTDGTKKPRWYFGVLFLFICSLLSKPVAVMLPVTLLSIDYFEKRKFTRHIWLEKIPHFAISLAFGIKSVMDQHGAGALSALDIKFNFVETMAIGCYAFITYLWKTIVPIHLLPIYPYPLNPEGTLSAICYVYPFLTAGVFFVLWKFFRKNRAVVFGFLFFLTNIVLLLQFIPVGGSIIADRYTYIPSFGLLFIAGWYISAFFEPGNFNIRSKVALAIVLSYSLILGYLSNERCKAWYDSNTLWRDAIGKEPLRVPIMWNNLGSEYSAKYKEAVTPAEKKLYFDSAYYLLTRAASLQPTLASPSIALGILLRSEGRFEEAKTYYYHALSLPAGTQDTRVYVGLANIYAMTRNFDSSAYCFRVALRLNPNSAITHTNLGNLFDMTGKTDSAISHYSIAISLQPGLFDPYFNRGRLLQRQSRCDEAIKDFEKAQQLNPKAGNVYYARSFCHYKQGNKAYALRDVEQAISLGFRQIDNGYYQSLKSGN